MTDLEKRADEYADKRASAYNMPKSSFVIPLLKVAYKTGATQETALLSQHILDLQKDKGNLTDRVRELEQQIEQLVYLHNEDVRTIKLLNKQIEKMKCLLNEIYSEFGFSELVRIRNDLPFEVQDVIKEIKEND